MPLVKSASKKALKENIETEMEEHPGKENRAQNLAIAYNMKRQARKKMADGGSVAPEQQKDTVGSIIGYPGYPKPKGYFNGGAVAPEYEVEPNHMAMLENDKDLNQHGEEDHGPMGGRDIVDRIIQKMSQGGKVANATPIEAGFSPAEFDDLVLRDDLNSSYGDDDNAGDALGNAQEDEDRSDIVARILKSRAKKDRMPRPA